MARTFAPATHPADERRRLAVLRGFQLLDSPREELFDAFARLAAQLCGVPAGAIGLVDDRREWFKASTGLPECGEVARDVSFAACALTSADVLEVADAAADARFAGNPLVRDEPRVRFFAAAPLVTGTGDALGALVVMDVGPNRLDDGRRASLAAIARVIVNQFEARRALFRLLDSSRTELYHIDLDAECFVFASEAAQRNAGFAPAEWERLAVATFLPQLGGEGRLRERLARLRGDAGEDVVLRTLAHRKNGTTYPIELRFELRQTREHTIALAFGKDLTESEAARERIELLSAAIEAAQDAIIISAPGARASDPSRIVYVNEAFLREKGATFEEVTGKPTDMFFGPKTDRTKLALMREVLMRGEESRIEYVTYRKDGSPYYVEIAARPLVGPDGRTTHFVLVQRDVTDSVMRGMVLELQNERLTTLTSIARGLFASLEPRALVDALLAGVRELTGGSGRLLAVCAAGDFISTADLATPPGAPALEDGFLGAALHSDVTLVDGTSRRAAVRISGPSDTAAFVLDVEAGAEPFATADVFAIGLLAQYLAVAVRNVEVYGELAARRSAVIELNQVKNDLIAMLAHDFKGPLTTIVGFADVLAEDERFDAESRQYLGMISSSALRLASLATDTLALSRLEQNELRLQLARVDLAALLRDVVRVFSVTRGIELRVPGEALVVTGDESRLRQVFENLIGNAIKYSPGGEPVHVTLLGKPGGVEITIRDRGIGIPAGDLGKLFGRFARASNARERGISGTGFGLYLARTIVDMHGGRIAVESSEGAGSTFRVFVPETPAPQRVRSRRVLLLDADGDARSYVAHTLRDEGYAVEVVTDEAEMVRALRASAYDAAVVDIDRLAQDPAAFVRDAGGAAALVRLGSGTADGAPWDAHVAKPFLIKDLKAAVEAAVARHAASGDSSSAASSAAGSA
ncbi:MAG: ATP-binding protein [Candidatus Velthaea sp.]